MPSMIQSYVSMIQDRKAQKGSYAQDAWRTNVKAYKPIGKLIENNGFSLTKTFKNDIQSLKYFAKGVKGDGNDYSIGRINDVAIKLGALGIAGMLAAGTGSPLKKGMEFGGLVSWLAAMSLWPKLAINKPVKQLKGVDLDLEYQNSAGRVKNFYSDPQFICWDMMSDEQINAMGDKLGIPKNIYNRRKATENKAKQVAIQANTLSALTSGLATPLIASLAADQIGRRLYFPLLGKIRDMNMPSLKEEMLATSGLIEDAHTLKIINSSVGNVMTPEGKNSLKSFFAKKTDDIGLRKIVSETVDKIFKDDNARRSVIALDDKTADFIADKINSGYEKEKISNLIKVVSTKFGNSLDEMNFNEYIAQVGQIIKEKNLLSDSKKIEGVLQDISKTLKSQEVMQLVSVDVTKNKLVNLAKLLDTYNVKIHQDYNKFLKYTIVGDSSDNAQIWEEASEKMLKALKLDKDSMKALTQATSLEQSNKIIANAMENILKDPAQYEQTVGQLANIAAKLSSKNEKAVDFSLRYLDKMQTIFNAYEKSGDFAAISEQLNKIIANYRKEVLGKYMSTNNTIFAPIKVLTILNEAKADKNIDYNVLKQLLFNSQNAESFINKLDNYKNVIKTTDDYTKYMDLIFGGIPQKSEKLLPADLASLIKKDSQVMRVMLGSLSDDVNLKFPIASGEEVISALKDSRFANYIDEYFVIYFNKTGEIAEKIIETVQKNPVKLEELKGFLKLSAEDLSEIASGNMESIKKALLGSKKLGAGYLENGRHRFKNIIQFLDIKNIDDLGSIFVKNSKICKVTSLEGQNLASFIKDSAKKSFVYNGWLKKVGISLAALTAFTAFAISRLGKRNEFNPDIYKERKSA